MTIRSLGGGYKRERRNKNMPRRTGAFKSDREYQEHLERERMAASKHAAEEFLTKLMMHHPDDEWLLEGLVLLTDLLSRPNNVAEIQDLASELQDRVWKFTYHRDDAFRTFVADVKRREAWLPRVV